MTESLKEQYNFTITQGGIQNILHQLKKKFGKKYQIIINQIRKSKVKHADETGWRIQGANNWCWLFASPKAVYYTIEETRGRGVPENILGNNSKGTLVRDDYAVYKHLPIEQQSCWAHLLRKSREASQRDNASKEVIILHNQLKNIFHKLKTIIAQPFNQAERSKTYQYYCQRLNKIQKTRYKHKDTKAIQTRIRNQGNNLLTALKYQNIPLTNNHAERQIRPMVITRKISGGSQSPKGAGTHAVNMSIVQTIALQGKFFFTGIRQLLAHKNYQFVLERTE